MRYSVQTSSYLSRASYSFEREGISNVSFTYDRFGNRKYTTMSERRRFIKAARAQESSSIRTFCLVLAFTGARLSEVLALTPRQIDFAAGVVVFRTLKQRKRDKDAPTFRAVPVPPSLLQEIEKVHAIKAAQHHSSRIDERIWPWCRTTAWKRVKEVMQTAKITGLQASPKGLRHGFAVGALVAGVPDITVMRWLGHARIETTMIYAEAMGAEAQTIAQRMWKPLLRTGLQA